MRCATVDLIGSSIFPPSFVLRGRDAGMRQVLAQVPDALSIERIAVMRAVEDALDPVQHHADARTRERLDLRAQVTKQGFDLAPVNVRADRVAEDGADQVLVLVTHGWRVSMSRRVSGWPASPAPPAKRTSRC